MVKNLGVVIAPPLKSWYLHLGILVCIDWGSKLTGSEFVGQIGTDFICFTYFS